MSAVRGALQRFFRHRSGDTASNLEYSYRVYWMTIARGWDTSRRRQVRATVEAVTHLPGFLPNELLRRYPVPQIDDLPHAGASLVALLEVLEALEAETEEVDDG